MALSLRWLLPSPRLSSSLALPLDPCGCLAQLTCGGTPQISPEICLSLPHFVAVSLQEQWVGWKGIAPLWGLRKLSSKLITSCVKLGYIGSNKVRLLYLYLNYACHSIDRAIISTISTDQIFFPNISFSQQRCWVWIPKSFGSKSFKLCPPICCFKVSILFELHRWIWNLALNNFCSIRVSDERLKLQSLIKQ